jgi:hypothetical protein
MRKQLDAKEYTVTRQAETKVTEGGTETRLEPMQLLDPPDLPLEWPLMIGDFASNARAALDHLAWQLALRNTWSASRARKARKPWPPEDTEFPIYASIPNTRTAKRLKTKLSRFRPADRKLVAKEQPHNRGNLAHAEPLWMLHHIRNTDTHRTLHTVLATVPFSLVGEMYRPGSPFYLPGKFTDLTASLRAGDVLQTTLKVEANFSPYVTFDQRGADFHGQEVLPLLHRCRDEVERILGLF